MTKLYHFSCPYCGSSIGEKRLDSNNVPEVAIRFDCKKCGLHYRIAFEDDSYPKWPMLWVNKSDKLYCAVCGNNGNAKKNILKQGKDPQVFKHLNNPRYRLKIFHSCPSCFRKFYLYDLKQYEEQIENWLKNDKSG